MKEVIEQLNLIVKDIESIEWNKDQNGYLLQKYISKGYEIEKIHIIDPPLSLHEEWDDICTQYRQIYRTRNGKGTEKYNEIKNLALEDLRSLIFHAGYSAHDNEKE